MVTAALSNTPQKDTPMRLNISKAELVRLLGATTKVVEARNTIPILSMVRLVAAAGKLAVTATDLDITISASAACDIEADGEICVDATRCLASLRLRWTA
jgi:DNA polymerase-3 subunit beta